LKNVKLYGNANFSIDPEKNNLSGARFSLFTVEGLLHKYKN
jgi:hypothetical protein